MARRSGKPARSRSTPSCPSTASWKTHWKYYVPQPIPDDAVAKAPDSVRALKLLDPACGSGHFLVIAFDLLAALYREEARHLGTTVSDKQMAESILENNLHGIDIDPRAIQIAAAGLYLKAKSLREGRPPQEAQPRRPRPPARQPASRAPRGRAARQGAEGRGGHPGGRSRRSSSRRSQGVDYLGSLLKVDAAIEEALTSVELRVRAACHGQGDLFKGFPVQQVKLSLGEAKATILDKLEQFLAKHSRSEDLGLRLDGEQLAAGVRFVRMAKEGTYDVVVGNPPYQGTAKTREFEYVASATRGGRPDLYAAFLERGLELAAGRAACRRSSRMRGWMFLGAVRRASGASADGTAYAPLADLGTGAFSSRSMDDVISHVVSSYYVEHPWEGSVAIQPHPPEDRGVTTGKPARTRGGTSAAGRALRVRPAWVRGHRGRAHCVLVE